MNLLPWHIGGRKMGRSECETGRKEERINQTDRIELAFWTTKRNLNNSEKDKIWRDNEDAQRKEEVGRKLPTISEEGGAGNSSEYQGVAFRAVLEMVGVGEISQRNRRLTQKKMR